MDMPGEFSLIICNDGDMQHLVLRECFKAEDKREIQVVDIGALPFKPTVPAFEIQLSAQAEALLNSLDNLL